MADTMKENKYPTQEEEKAQSATTATGLSMGFATPHARFSGDVRAFLDETIETLTASNGHQSLAVHLRKGLQQLETFMRHHHTIRDDNNDGLAVPDFATMVARESHIWENHVKEAKKSRDLTAKTRPLLLEALQVNLIAMDLKAGRPGRPDDSVYAQSEYARKYMPRGNFIGVWEDEKSQLSYYFPIIRAYRKFTGHEDDGEVKKDSKTGEFESEAQVSKFFTKPVSESRWMIRTTKENGEAGHLAVLKRSDGCFLFAVGSKNTHLLTTLSLDTLEAAQHVDDSNNPFKAAVTMGRAILKMLIQLSEEKRTLLCEFLWQTRATASFEILCPDHQHVQLLDYISEDTPIFYGLSLPSFDAQEGAEICVNPVLPFEFMRALGIRTVTYEVLDYTPENVEQAKLEIKHTHQHEGAVNLFLHADAYVIGMEKYKSAWYVCLRAIREKAKTFCHNLYPKKQNKRLKTPKQILQDTHNQINRRFVDIQGYLQLTSEVCLAYRELGHQFIEFLFTERLTVKRTGQLYGAEQAKDVKRMVADLFPVVWKEFLEHTQLSDAVHG